jgi:hypothetical protein
VTVLVGVGEWYNVAVTVVLQAVCKLGFEDIISKRATSVYRSGPSRTSKSKTRTRPQQRAFLREGFNVSQYCAAFPRPSYWCWSVTSYFGDKLSSAKVGQFIRFKIYDEDSWFAASTIRVIRRPAILSRGHFGLSVGTGN